MTRVTPLRALPGVLAAGALVLAALPLAAAAPAAAAPSATAPSAAAAAVDNTIVTITSLSTRADLVSGHDVLLGVTVPAGASGLRVSVDGRDVTGAFGTGPDGTLQGLVTGLRLGANTVTAVVADGRGATLQVADHPIGGPTFSGPQIQPWACQPGATDAQCDAPTTVTYRYLPAGAPNTSGGGTGGSAYSTPLQAYDPANPPPTASIATTTTDTGVTVPFIVRTEDGYLDRDAFQTSVLYQPDQPWTPVKPQAQWNRKLVLTHGASCDTTYGTGAANDTKGGVLLGHGYVLASHALDNAGHNCNLVTEAESLLMTKEHVQETYGALRWTIGSGCSGGSLVQQQVANAYPGIYQAITPQCSFTDAWSSSMEYEDYVAILKFLQDRARTGTTAYDPVAIQSILDHPNVGNPVTFTQAIPNSGDAERSCPRVPADQQFNPATGTGVKCTLSDYQVNVFGTRPDGFANRPFDNTGIQYGLKGLLTGAVSVDQFTTLNAGLGGFDIRGQVQPGRTLADPVGLDRVYTSGLVDGADHLDQIPIIDLRGPDFGSFHDVYRTYAMRARLVRDHRTAANQLLWRGQVDLLGDTNYADQAVIAADRWVASIHADARAVPQAQKVIEDKPADLTDRCTNGSGTDAPAATCDATVVSFGTPRFAAGMPLTDDTLKCQLQPLDRSSYRNPAGTPITFTDAQWARLVAAFPTGVCDYARPGVSQHAATTWQRYDVPGGTPMGDAPVSVPFGPAAAGAGTATQSTTATQRVSTTKPAGRRPAKRATAPVRSARATIRPPVSQPRRTLAFTGLPAALPVLGLLALGLGLGLGVGARRRLAGRRRA